jgi:hypothetical protein
MGSKWIAYEQVCLYTSREIKEINGSCRKDKGRFVQNAH